MEQQACLLVKPGFRAYSAMNPSPIFKGEESPAGPGGLFNAQDRKNQKKLINGGYNLEIHQSTAQGVTIITLIGRMDTKSTMAFEEDRRTWKAGPIILDLGSLDYICSSGLRVFLQLKRDCANKNTPVAFAGYQGSVEKVIRVSGFENIFPRYSTVEDALAAVAAGSA